MILDQLSIPIVLAPLAGGASTPQLTAAVSNAGGLGFTPAGYLTAAALAVRLAATHALTSALTGVNVFVPGIPVAPGIAETYAATLADDARETGVGLGTPRFDDDDWTAKIEFLLCARHDPGLVNLWAGQTHQLGRELPAGQLARELADQAGAACQQAVRRLSLRPEGR